MVGIAQVNAILRAVIDYIAEQSTMIGAGQGNTVIGAVRDRIVGQSVVATGPTQVNTTGPILVKTIFRTFFDRIVGQSIIATGITFIKINALKEAVRDRIIGQNIIATGIAQDDAILGAVINRITGHCTMVGIV